VPGIGAAYVEKSESPPVFPLDLRLAQGYKRLYGKIKITISR
jgi:hypothetical protein